MCKLLKVLRCILSGHRFGDPIREVDQFGNQWLVQDCVRCGRTEVIERPPPIVVVHTVSSQVIGRG